MCLGAAWNVIDGIWNVLSWSHRGPDDIAPLRISAPVSRLLLSHGHLEHPICACQRGSAQSYSHRMTDLIDPRARPDGPCCTVTPVEDKPLVYTHPSGCLSPHTIGAVCGPEHLVPHVQEMLDDRMIGKVAVPQLLTGHWICLTEDDWYTLTDSRDHLADVIAAMLVAGGLGAEIDQDGLDLLLDATCWGDGGEG